MLIGIVKLLLAKETIPTIISQIRKQNHIQVHKFQKEKKIVKLFYQTWHERML